MNSANGEVECRDLVEAHRQYHPFPPVDLMVDVWLRLDLKFEWVELLGIEGASHRRIGLNQNQLSTHLRNRDANMDRIPQYFCVG